MENAKSRGWCWALEMDNEFHGCSGRQADPGLSNNFTPNDQNYGDEYPHNISVQTGEEFSPEFLRDRIASRRMPFVNEIDQFPSSKQGFDAVRNHHLVYNDQAGSWRIRRVDSENGTECSDMSPGKGYAFDMDFKAYMDVSGRYGRDLQATSPHQRKFSGDVDRGPTVSPFDTPNFYQAFVKAPVILNGSFSARKIKFLCSFGGKILPRPNDGKLRYAGGETRIISIRKNLTYLELIKKTTEICSYPHAIKYQLPGEDMDALISVSSDEDLHHMIEEYHELDRGSNRLRIFLIPSSDLEGAIPSETKTIQQSDPDYQYVVAVNGMLDPTCHRSSSRESIENQGGSNIESQKAGSSINLNLMFSSPGAQVFHTPQVLSNIHIPSSVSPIQFKDINNSTMKGYNDVGSSCGRMESTCCVDASNCNHGHPNDSVPVIFSPNPSSHVVQSHATPTMSSSFLQPGIGFESPSLYGPNYLDVTRGFPNAMPLHSGKLVPSQDVVGLSPTSDVHAQSCRMAANNFSEAQPMDAERPSVRFERGTDMACQISRDIVELYQETPNHNRDYEWDKGLTTWAKSNGFPPDEMAGYCDANNNNALNGKFLEHKQNLPRIICQLDSKFSLYIPTPELQVNGGKNSSQLLHSAENTKENWQELLRDYKISPNEPEFLIKSQRVSTDNNQSQPSESVLFPNDELCAGVDLRYPLVFPPNVLTAAVPNQEEKPIESNDLGSTTKDMLDLISHKELSGSKDANVEPQILGNCPETRAAEMCATAEHVKDNLPADISSSSKAIPSMQVEHKDRIESPGAETEAGSVISESEHDNANVDEDRKDAPLNDAATIEMEASIHGLQIIRNADLEDLQELGSGTYGTVYHGKWRGTDVAIKRIKKSCFSGRSSEQEQLTKDFWREAKILSTLHHPNVVAFYGVVPDNPSVPLATVTEYMANGSLRRVLQRKDRSLDQRKKVMIALDAAFGMEYLHLKNIVHFDLKCDNLLVNLGDPHRPVCKVGDFGLSRIKQNTLVSGGVRGTLPWMAPELLNGCSSRVSEKVDIFSFGIAMWELVTGEEPYANMHCGAIIGGIVNNSLRPPIPDRCDPEWRKLMEECWSHDPDSRPSFTEITNQLRTMSQALQPKRYTRLPAKR